MSTLLFLVLGFAFAAYILIGPGLGISAHRRLRERNHEIDELRRALDRVERELAALRGSSPSTEPPQAAPAAEAPAKPAPAEAAPAAATASPVAAIEEAPTDSAIEPPPPAGAWTAGQTATSGWEQALGMRWMVWLGAATAALGGAFLVKHSIEQEWIGPTARVSGGFLLGMALMVGGEWLRRQPLQRAIAKVRPDYVPPALTAVGLFTAFASVYAAFELYNLLSPLAAFVLLAALAAMGLALSLLQGPLIALVGLVGGYVTPGLVPSDQPSAWALFSYLLFLVAASLAVVRYKDWWWLAWANLAGAAIWPFLWFAGSWHDGDAVPAGAYLWLVAALHFFLRRPGEAPPVSVESGLPEPPELVAWASAIAVAALVFALVRLDKYGGQSLAVLLLVTGLYLVVGRREQTFDGLGVLAALLSLAAVAAWHLPNIISTTGPIYVIEGSPFGRQAGPVLPPEIVPFMATTAGLAALFGGAGFAALWGAWRPALWAGMSAATPMLLLVLAYWRVADFTVDLKWAAVALGLAGVAVAAATRVERHRHIAGFDLALAAYAAGACAGVGLALTFALRDAWLTVALSLQLPALAWIDRQLRLAALRKVALIISAIVLARLVLNPNIIDYDPGAWPLLNWITYGYGVPAIAFFLAAREFRRSADDNLVLILESGALLFFVVLVTFEIHQLVTGPLAVPRSGLLEPSLQSLAWLTMALALAASPRWSTRTAALWGRRILAALAALQIVLVQLLAENPLWSGLPVGDWPLVNLLFVAYAAPAVVGLAYVWIAREPPAFTVAARILGLVLVFAYLSLELRRAFHGPIILLGATSDAEWYSYSALWLIYAGGLFALGIRSGTVGLRHAALAVLLLTIGKVFFSDMGNLTGLYRAASFIGLGLSLIGIGYLYQRFVFPLHRQPRTAPAPD